MRGQPARPLAGARPHRLRLVAEPGRAPARALRPRGHRPLSRAGGILAGARGRRVRAPGTALLSALARRFPKMPFIAEGPGVITPDVCRARDRFGLPGTRVLLLAFSHPDSCHLPADSSENRVFYAGTHANNTARGWFECEATTDERGRLSRPLGRHRRGPAVDGHCAFCTNARRRGPRSRHRAYRPLRRQFLDREARQDNKNAKKDLSPTRCGQRRGSF